MADLTLRERCEKRLEGLKALRQPYEADWKEIIRYAAPGRGRFLTSESNRSRKKPVIYDGHAIRSFRTQRQGLTSGLSSRSRPWFKNKTFNEDLLETPDAREWLDVVERRMYDFIAGTNFYGAAETGYGELGLFAAEADVMIEDRQFGLVCHPLTVGEYWIALSSSLKVDTLYRDVPMTVMQAMQHFGRDKVSDRVRAAYDRSAYDEMVEAVHAIEPNFDRDPTKIDFRNKPWRSIWWDKNAPKGEILREGGFNEKPFWCARWDTIGGDAWGVGPGNDALPDMRELQMLAKRDGEAMDYYIWPEIIADPRVKLKRQARAVTSVADFDQSRVLVPYELDPSVLMASEQRLQAKKRDIDASTFADLFMAITNMEGIQPRNLEEIASRNEEKLTQLGSVVDQINEEKLEVFLDRVFGVMSRGGLLPPAPEVLQDQDIKFEYTSMLTQMQRMVGIGQIERTAAFVGNQAAAFPEVADKWNADEAVDEYAQRTGTPARLIRSDDEVAAIREARAEQQQAEAMAAAAPAVKDYADAARLLSETDAGNMPLAGAGGMPL